MTGKDVRKEGHEQDENHTATRQGNSVATRRRSRNAIGRWLMLFVAAVNEWAASKMASC